MAVSFQARGLSLLEVLVAQAVFGLGLLGLSALQWQSLQQAQAGFQETVADAQVQDLLERSWAAFCLLPGRSSELFAQWQQAQSGHPRMTAWADADQDGHIDADVWHVAAGERHFTVRLSWVSAWRGESRLLTQSVVLPQGPCTERVWP